MFLCINKRLNLFCLRISYNFLSNSCLDWNWYFSAAFYDWNTTSDLSVWCRQMSTPFCRHNLGRVSHILWSQVIIQHALTSTSFIFFKCAAHLNIHVLNKDSFPFEKLCHKSQMLVVPCVVRVIRASGAKCWACQCLSLGLDCKNRLLNSVCFCR